MKTYINKIAALSLSTLLVLSATGSNAGVPEPDNLVYGTFTLNSVPVTAADTSVILEMVVQGNVIASYTMGDNEDILDRYLLTVPLDTVGARSNTSARPGDQAIIRFNVAGAITNLDTLTLGERGTTTQLDLAATIALITDTDSDGIKDSLDNDDDNDGIDDAIEIALRTDPLFAEGSGPNGIWLDADNDGLPDFIETNLTLTDPQVADVLENSCTPTAGGLTGQWDLRITDRRTGAELADSQYPANYPTTAPADVRFDAESLIGLSICDDVSSGLRVWAVGLGYAQSATFDGLVLSLSWNVDGITTDLSTVLQADSNAVFTEAPKLMVGSWTQGSTRSLRMERRSLLNNSVNISGIYAAQRTYLDTSLASIALGPMGSVISSHSEVVQTAPGDLHVTIYDDQGRAMPAFYIPSIGALVSATGINTEVDTTGDEVLDSVRREVSFFAGLYLESPVSNNAGMLRGEWSQTVDLDIGNDGPTIDDTSYQLETAFYARGAPPRAKVQTVNQQDTGYYSEAVLNNVPTSSPKINLVPNFGTDVGAGLGIAMAVANNTLDLQDMGDWVRIHNRLSAFVDGEQVGRANDGSSLDVSELSFSGTPDTLFAAGNFYFSASAPVGGSSKVMLATYTPVAVPHELLPVVDTNGVMLDGVVINTGEVNTTDVYGLATHSLTWDHVNFGGVSGGGAGSYRASFSTIDGSLFSLLGTDQFHIDVDGSAACNITTNVCEITIEPFTLGADPVDLVMTIEAEDAADPLNLSRTTGFYLKLNSDAADGDEDGIADDVDNCTLVANPGQLDSDGDNYGNRCDPDFDNNGVVNASDLAFFKSKFFTTDPDADLNGNGIVNAADLAILKTMFFRPPGPSGLAP